MASNNSTKRRRTAADTLHISDLPAGFIADVSAYLPKPSRAILAVAFTSSSLWKWKNNLMHRPSPISKAIVSASQWDILDFEDIEKELANKLTDYDISTILECINAHDVLKRLKLCGCINITGIGLYPLRSSVVLEQIDLSLIRKYVNPNIVCPDSKCSEEVIVAVLDSIISSNACSLKHITFPRKWRGDGQFSQRYNLLCNSRGICCSKCNVAMSSDHDWMTSSDRMLQNNVCYDCLKPFCDNCTDEDGALGRKTLNFCSKCDKDYCVDCVPRTECTNSDCDNNMCSGCAETRKCQKCNETKYGGCLNTCNGCNRALCGGCVSFYRCSECEREYCVDCQISKDYDGGCVECKSNYKSSK